MACQSAFLALGCLLVWRCRGVLGGAAGVVGGLWARARDVALNCVVFGI